MVCKISLGSKLGWVKIHLKRLQVCIDVSFTLTPHPSAEARHSTTPHVPAKKVQRSMVFPDPWYAQIPGMQKIPGFKIWLGQDSLTMIASVH